MTTETQSTIGKGRGVAVLVASVVLGLGTALRRLSNRFRSLGAELNLA